MPFIENIAYIDVVKGDHLDPGPNSLLIQIVDIHLSECPKPKYTFSKTLQFAFVDAEKTDEIFEEFGMKEIQAAQIAEALLTALREDTNVVVHCMAGLCRSGAVVECGIQLGFEETPNIRHPNVTVKNMILKQLGLTYNPDESTFNDWRKAPVWK